MLPVYGREPDCCPYYDFENIITPEGTRNFLKRGHFQEECFAYYMPQKVDVTACALAYAVDLKEFCQLIYAFELRPDKNESPLSLKNPAIP